MNILQIGTCEGNDHVFGFCKENADKLSRVILVEPLGFSLNLAKKCYEGIPNCEFLECAVVVDGSDTVEIFIPSEQEDDISAHASVRKNHVLALDHEDTRSVFVKATDISTLLNKFKSPVDRLYIDTEGLDAEIIMQIDLDKFKIPFIQFEYVHNDGPYTTEEKTRLVLEKLNRARYSCHENGFDFICTLST